MAEDRDWVAEATAQGWDENYEGENKVDAQVFVEKGERIAAIAQSQRNKAQAENVRLEGRLAKLEQANEDFGKYKDEQLARSEARNKDLLAELSRRRSQAVADNDGEAFHKADREYEEVRDNMNASSPQQSNGGEQSDPLFDAWRINNDWFDTDPVLRTHAYGLNAEIANEGYQGPAFYRELTKRVENAFPDKFKNKRRAGTTGVEPGGELETKPDSTAHTYENLPPDAKAACDRFIASGHTTKESYCKSYDWE